MEDNKTYMKKSLILWSTLLVISILLGYSVYNAFSGRIYASVFESMNNNLRFAESSYSVFINQMKMGMLQASVETNIKELISIGNSKDELTLAQYVIVPVMENEKDVIGGIVTLMNLDGDDNITGKIMNDTGMYSIISAKHRIIASSLESGLYILNTGSSFQTD